MKTFQELEFTTWENPITGTSIPKQKPKELDWEIEFDGQFGGLTGEVIDKYDLDAIKLFISKTLQQQREYEFTRKEIIEWLHEQNWKCEQLEKLLLKK